MFGSMMGAAAAGTYEEESFTPGGRAFNRSPMFTPPVRQPAGSPVSDAQNGEKASPAEDPPAPRRLDLQESVAGVQVSSSEVQGQGLTPAEAAKAAAVEAKLAGARLAKASVAATKKTARALAGSSTESPRQRARQRQRPRPKQRPKPQPRPKQRSKASR
jgi:hypothetical protein